MSALEEYRSAVEWWRMDEQRIRRTDDTHNAVEYVQSICALSDAAIAELEAENLSTIEKAGEIAAGLMMRAEQAEATIERLTRARDYLVQLSDERGAALAQLRRDVDRYIELYGPLLPARAEEDEP